MATPPQPSPSSSGSPAPSHITVTDPAGTTAAIRRLAAGREWLGAVRSAGSWTGTTG